MWSLLLAACASLTEVSRLVPTRRFSPHWRLLLPEGPGPYPAAVTLQGSERAGDAAVVLDALAQNPAPRT